MNAQLPYSEPDAQYRQAHQRVLQLKGFYSHLASFVVVNAGLVAINLLFSPGSLWFLWRLLGWEERKIREYMEKARRP